MINKESLGRLIEYLQEEIKLTAATIKDRGSNRFSRAYALGLVMILFSYALVYRPPVKKIAALQKKIAEAQSTAQFAEQYKDLRLRLSAAYSQLPPMKDRDQWLTNTVVESMRSENLFADSIQPPSEAEQSGLVFQKVDVSVQLKFAQAVSWLNRLENTKPFLHVASFELAKKSDPLGSNGVSCSLGTVITARRPGQ